jgi:short-subunit dehydrogenase
LNIADRGGVAVITGTSSGIGRALARALAASGCRVGLIARREALLAELEAEILAGGGMASSASADVTDRPALRLAFEKIERELGPADLVVANAGVGVPTTIDPMNVDAIEEMIRVNLLGLVYTIEMSLPSMLGRGAGHIVAISSLSAYKGMPGESAYCASKAAVNTFMEGFRVQLRGRGVDVSTICPGFVKTPMTALDDYPMPFAMEPEEAARRILRAIERRARVASFPWQTAAMVSALGFFQGWQSLFDAR